MKPMRVLLALLVAVPLSSAWSLDAVVFSNLNQPDSLPQIGVPVTNDIRSGLAIPFTTDASNTELTTVRLFISSTGASDTINVSIWDVDDSGPTPRPGNPVGNLIGPRNPDPTGSDYVSSSVMPPIPLSLQPDTSYYLVILNNTSGSAATTITRFGTGSDLAPPKYTLGIPGVSPPTYCRRVSTTWDCAATPLSSSLFPVVEIVAGPPAPTLVYSLTANPGSFDFGSVAQNTESAPQDVAIENDGTAAQTLGQLSTAQDFLIKADTCSNQALAPGASCSVSVAFGPTVGGQAVGVLRIPADPADPARQYGILLSGQSPAEFSVGGTLGGLAANGTVIIANLGNQQALTLDGPFTFPSQNDGAGYQVVIVDQPTGQTCAVTNGAGVIAGADVTDIQIDCVDNQYAVGGLVSGLVPGDTLVLQNNGQDDLTLTADGPFRFSRRVDYQGTYAVTVKAQPTSPSETCTVANGAGVMGAGDVSTVSVTCTVNTFTVGGDLAGLAAGESLVLLLNGTQQTTLNADGGFQFLPLADGTAYSVTVAQQPMGQTCTVSNGSGTLAGSNVGNVAVSCDPNTYLVGGNLSGLVAGKRLVLVNNGVDDLTLNADGAFTFATPVASGSAYDVTIKTPPAGETCTVSNGSGTVQAADINRVSVTCTVDSYRVTGNLRGLARGESVELLLNGTLNSVLTGNGYFQFPPIADGSPYAVTVGTQPRGQTCSVTNGSGTLAGAQVTNVAVDCFANTYSIGGQISGLVPGDTVVLQNNGGDDLSLAANGSFTFPSQVPYQDAYSVTVLTQPSAPNETCTVTNGSGIVADADVTSVNVTCTLDTFSVGGTVSGLAAGQTVELVNNGANPLTVTADGSFQFPALADGSAYAVSVSSQPASQACSVANGSGALAGANVTAVAVTCLDDEYTLGGLLSGLVPGDSVVLQNNGGDDLVLSADGPFTFRSTLNLDDAYAITVLAQPPAPSETCTVTNGSGTMPARNVTSVSVTCVLNTFPVQGTLAGLAAGNSITLQLNGGQDTVLTVDGPFVFPTLADGSAYAVTVLSQPAGQACSVVNGSGVLGGMPVTDVVVNCIDTPYTIGGLLSGLAPGDSVVLQNSGADDLTLSSDGAFVFATPVDFGDPYAVTVLVQPPAPSETCTVTNGSGITPAGNVGNVSVTCALDRFSVGGTVTGLAPGGRVVLQNNGADDRIVTADGNFTFTAQADGAAYSVAVVTQPAGQVCSVANGDGTLAGNDVTTVAVTCADLRRSFSGLLPSGNTGSLSFNTTDASCAFVGDPQFGPAPAAPAPPPGLLLVDGVVRFTIGNCTPGATVDLEFDYGRNLPPGTGYWKVGAPWRPMPAAVSGSVVRFSLTDGGAFDDDGALNGTIVDPSGAGRFLPRPPPTPVPANGAWALLLLLLLMGVAGAAGLRRR